MNNPIDEERFSDTIYGEYPDSETAVRAREELVDAAQFDPGNVSVISPGEYREDRFSKRIEPETRRIRGTLWRSHAVLGPIGGVVGFAVMLVAQAQWITNPPGYPLLLPLVGLLFGAVGGLLLAGLYSLKPSHGVIAAKIRDAGRAGRWCVVVQARDASSAETAEAILKRHSDRVSAVRW